MLALLSASPAGAPPPALTKPNPLRIEADDYALTAALFLTSGAAIFLAPQPPSGWKRGWLFDDALQEAIGGKNDGQEKLATVLSDAVQNGLLLYPLLDALGVGLFHEGGWPLAFKMAVSTLEVYALSSALVTVTKRVIGRVRPDVKPCEGTTDDFSCRSRAGRRGLLSGHATASFAAAGAACAHHKNLKLYGRPWLDNFACISSLVLATGGAISRVAANVHYTTDVLLGSAVGLLVGYGLPELLHYRERAIPSEHRIDGDFALFALGGGATEGAQPRLTGGAGVALRHILWMSKPGLLIDEDPGVGLELGIDGLLLRSASPLFVEQLRGHAQLWFSHLALGFSAELRTLRVNGPRTRQGLGGPVLSLGLLRRALPITLQARWLPLLDGAPSMFSLGLSAGLARYLHLGVEVFPLLTDGGKTQGAVGLLKLGGRLAW